jgi:hypothetical protein
MSLTKQQEQAVDALIIKNKKTDDIIDDLVAVHGAKTRDVKAYLGENKTLQSTLKTISHRVKDIENAGDQATRTEAAAEIQKLTKRAIKMAQNAGKDAA